MTEYLKFSIPNERIVYINRNYITDFIYDPNTYKTMISLIGTNCYTVIGDQTKKILEGGGEDG